MRQKSQTFNRGLVSLLDQRSLDSLSGNDLSNICYSLSLTLTHAFAMIGDSAGMHDWSVDNMDAETYTVYPGKLSMGGNIKWLKGGGTCKSYQANIAINSSPLLYSFKLIDANDDQQFFLRKSYSGWTVE